MELQHLPLPQRTWWRIASLLAFSSLLTIFFLGYGLFAPRLSTTVGLLRTNAYGVESSLRHGAPDSLHLDEEECIAAFPGLTTDVDKMVELGPFTLHEAKDTGPLQVRIDNGQLYIIHKEGADILSRGYLDARMAMLHQIHRAILTSPNSLPNTIISLNVLDSPVNDTWSYARQASPTHILGSPAVTRAFLMPHFSFWGWPLPFVGSFSRAADAITKIESSLPFSAKDPRPVWRGTKRYSSAQSPQLRTNLLKIANNTTWADVEELAWDTIASNNEADSKNNAPKATNALNIEEFCKYKYILHTEGITYSGRFQFLQMCQSVVLTPPIEWLQHTTHLIKPMYTSDIVFPGRDGPSWTPSFTTNKAWPFHFKPEEANIVFLAPDWSDLKETTEWLEDHPDIAAGIGTRQRELFVGRGYLSKAAEVCYWRAAIRGWSKVVQTKGHGWETQVGTSWELLSLGYDSD